LNITDPILAQCRFQPDSPALCVPGDHHTVITYSRLDRMIRNVARNARAAGLKPGDRAVIFSDDQILHAALILGLARARVASISGRNPELPPELNIDVIIADFGRTFSRRTRVMPADFSWTAGDGLALDEEMHTPSGDEVCRLIFTSGTTGDAKAVAYTHRMVAERVARFDYLAGNLLAAPLRSYVELGFATSLGFLLLIRTLMRGGMLLLAGSCEAAMNACDLYRVDSWVGAPGSLIPMVELYEQSEGRRCNFQAMLAGGSLLSKSLSERVRSRMCSNLIAAYGSTETNMVATAPAYITAETPGAVGYLTPGMVVQAVDRDHRALPIGKEGLIRIRGPYNVNEYVDDPEESARAFRDGWFYPGDIGSITMNNLLIIAGRQKTVMNIGGDKVKPELIEDVLTAFSGVNEAGVFGFVNDYGIEEVWAVIASTTAVDEPQLHIHCQKRLPANFVPRRFIRAQALPKNEMGKVDRRRLPELAKTA
jgi:acyl-CoA synthetase (AMP-forming)/AMP-acid ligase II